jgi:hypothetical protein
MFRYSSTLTLPVQVSAGKILDNDIPIFVIQFSTQEVLLFRNAKTREIMVGAEDKVEQCTYVAAVTRLEEELENELTGGWKVVEVYLSIPLPDKLLIIYRWCGGVRGHIYSSPPMYIQRH